MPECRDHEYNHADLWSSTLTLLHKTALNVEFKPKMNLVVPALEHRHARVRCFDTHDVDSNYLVPPVLLFVIFNLYAIVGEAAGNHSSIRNNERSIVEESLASHCHVVKHDSLPER